MCAGDLCGRLAVDGMTVQAMQGSNAKSAMTFYVGTNPFRKIDGQAREGAVVDNLSEEFDPGSD